MKILKLHHPKGHSYWQKGQYKVELPNGEMLDLKKYSKNGLYSYEIFTNNNGVYMIDCCASSGTGKAWSGSPVLLVDKFNYDVIEYVGTPLEMSETLKQDITI